MFFCFFQAEDGIRDVAVTGVQTCALPIYATKTPIASRNRRQAVTLHREARGRMCGSSRICDALRDGQEKLPLPAQKLATSRTEIRRCLNAGEEVVFGESGKNFSEMGKCRSRRQATLSHCG